MPYSHEVNYATFSNVLKDDKVVASYKMYWLLSILDEAVLDRKRIKFRTLICKMICKAWYPISKFKLSFGYCDNLGKVVNYIIKTFPQTESLSATKIWKAVIERSQVKDIYTGLEFNDKNFREHGVLSIDHFIPWSFVLHDQMWNLVPTFKNVNSKKSDKLLPYGEYIDKFAKVQFNGFCYVVENNKITEVEEYREALKVYKVEELVHREEEFVKRLEEVVEPVYNIAVNQGF